MSELRKTSKDVLVYALVTLVPALLGFISVPIYTRLFSPTEYGQFSLVQMTANYVVIIILSWINSSFLRFYESSKKNKNENIFVNTYLRFLFVNITISLALYLGFVFLAVARDWFDQSLIMMFLWGSLLLVFNGFVNFFLTFFRTKRETFHYALVSISNSILTLLSALAFVLVFHYDVRGIIIGSALVSILLTAACFLYLFRRYDIGLIRNYDNKIFIEALHYGLPVIISGASVWMLRFADRYVIEFLRGTAEVGLYSVSYTISEKTVMTVITALALATTPALIYSWEHKGRKDTELLLKHFSRYQYMLLLPMVMGLIALAPEFMKIFVGEQYFEGYRATQVVAVGVMFLGLYNLTNTGLYIAKKTKIIARNVLAVGVINVILNLAFVPRIGYIAAAYNTLISYILLFIVSYVQTKDLMRWSIDRGSFLKITFSGGAMMALVFWGKGIVGDNILGLVTLTMAGVVSYFLLLFVMGDIKKETKIAVNYIKRRLHV